MGALARLLAGRGATVAAGAGVTLRTADTVVAQEGGWQLVHGYGGGWTARRVESPHRGDVCWLGGGSMTNAQARRAFRRLVRDGRGGA